MNGAKFPEFDPKRPAASAGAMLRGIFLTPKGLYQNFSAEGPLREPTLFVLLVSTMTGTLSVLVNLISVAIGASFDLLGVVVSNLAFVVLSPIMVGAAAGVYLLSARAFVGREASFRGVYRMLAYAYGAMILLPLPVIHAFAFTYAAFVLMLLGIYYAYHTSFLTAIITTLAGFVPVALAFIYLLIAVNGIVDR